MCVFFSTVGDSDDGPCGQDECYIIYKIKKERLKSIAFEKKKKNVGDEKKKKKKDES